MRSPEKINQMKVENYKEHRGAVLSGGGGCGSRGRKNIREEKTLIFNTDHSKSEYKK